MDCSGMTIEDIFDGAEAGEIEYSEYHSFTEYVVYMESPGRNDPDCRQA